MFNNLESYFSEKEKNVISFFSEDTGFQLQYSEKVQNWIEKVIEKEKAQLAVLNYIFCSDDYLYKMNIEYLQHDTLTDIITFPYDDPPIIHGDLFISIDRVKDNAQQMNLPFLQELFRVIIHGVLHLCGYGDKGVEEARIMRQKEEEMLHLATEMNLI